LGRLRPERKAAPLPRNTPCRTKRQPCSLFLPLLSPPLLLYLPYLLYLLYSSSSSESFQSASVVLLLFAPPSPSMDIHSVIAYNSFDLVASKEVYSG
jgi:hypothetical protein